MNVSTVDRILPSCWMAMVTGYKTGARDAEGVGSNLARLQRYREGY